MRKTNRIQCIEPFALAVALGLAGLNGCARFSGDPPSRPIALTLLHTNDTHSHLEPFPRDDELSAGNQGPQQGGIARRKTLIDAVRASEPNVLLVDAGDHFQGTIFHNAWKGSAEIMALNALSYDATTLGNHEFDRGPAELGRALRGEPVDIAGTVYPTEKPRPPIVVTNVDAGAEPALRGLFAPSAVLERGGERFGILGVVTEDVPAISSPGPNVRFLDAVSSVQKEADRLRAAGINKIILLSHSGYSVDLERAPRWRGVDVIVSGHDHALLGDPATVEAVAPGQGERVKGPYPTVTAGADGAPVLVVSGYEWGRWLGRLKIAFDERGVIQRWEGQPMFVRGCAFVRGAVDCTRQSAPEDPAVEARVATLPRAGGPVRPGGDRAGRDGFRRRADAGPAHPGNAAGQSDRRHDANGGGRVGRSGGGPRQQRRHPRRSQRRRRDLRERAGGAAFRQHPGGAGPDGRGTGRRAGSWGLPAGGGCVPAGGRPEAGLLRGHAVPGGAAVGWPDHGVDDERRPGGFGRPLSDRRQRLPGRRRRWLCDAERGLRPGRRLLPRHRPFGSGSTGRGLQNAVAAGPARRGADRGAVTPATPVPVAPLPTPPARRPPSPNRVILHKRRKTLIDRIGT